MFGTKETRSTQNDVLDATDEIDLTSDSPVEVVTATFVVESAERKDSESPKGTGKYEEIIASSDDFPYPITLRFFTEYAPTDPSVVKKFAKDGTTPLWVAQQRGILKTLAQAALGTTKYNRTAIVGRQFQATTRADSEGRATLGRFKAAS